MKWFNRWLKKKVAEAMCEEKVCEPDSNYYRSPLIGSVSGKAMSIDSDKAIRFTVSKAQGGVVIETSFYDRVKDRSNQGLYVIRDDQDIGKEIGKIITMETLKQ